MLLLLLLPAVVAREALRLRSGRPLRRCWSSVSTPGDVTDDVMKVLNVAEKNDAAKNLASIMSGGRSRMVRFSSGENGPGSGGFCLRGALRPGGRGGVSVNVVMWACGQSSVSLAELVRFGYHLFIFEVCYTTDVVYC